MIDTIGTCFKLPRSHKKAFEMVAADQETTPSELLRSMVEKAVREHRGGIFFDITARDDVQYGSVDNQSSPDAIAGAK